MMLLGCFANRPNLMLSNKYKIGENDFRCKGCDDAKFHHILYRTMYNLVASGAEEIDSVVVDTFLRNYPEQYDVCKQYDFMSFIPEIKRVTSDKNVAYYYEVVRKFAMLREYKAAGFDIHGKPLIRRILSYTIYFLDWYIKFIIILIFNR